MTTFNVNVTKHGTLAAGVVDIVNMGHSCPYVRIYNRSNVPDIYVRLDGVDPVAQANETFVVPPNSFRDLGSPDASATQVRLVSAALCTYSVECNL